MPTTVKRVFLQALFEGDGSCSVLPRNTIQVSYSTRSEQLAEDVQQMLLEFGVVSQAVPARDRRAQGRCHQPSRSRTVRQRVGFGGVKQTKLDTILARPEAASPSAMDGDLVPGLGAFLREHGAEPIR